MYIRDEGKREIINMYSSIVYISTIPLRKRYGRRPSFSARNGPTRYVIVQFIPEFSTGGECTRGGHLLAPGYNSFSDGFR